MTWRDKIRPLVAEIIAAVGTSDMKALRRALIEGRPSWVSGASWMTKVWRDEVNTQLGIKAARKAERRRSKQQLDGHPWLFSGDADGAND